MLVYVTKHSTHVAILETFFGYCFFDFSLVVWSSASAAESDSGSKSDNGTYSPFRMRCTSLEGTGGEIVFTVNGVFAWGSPVDGWAMGVVGELKDLVMSAIDTTVGEIGRWDDARENNGIVVRTGVEDALVPPKCVA